MVQSAGGCDVYWGEQVIALNRLNPQTSAARLIHTLDHWKKYKPALKKQMQAALQKVTEAKELLKYVQVVVVRTLGCETEGGASQNYCRAKWVETQPNQIPNNYCYCC